MRSRKQGDTPNRVAGRRAGLRSNGLGMGVLAPLLMVVAPPALTADDNQSQARAAALEEVIVTARRVQENLQEVPMTVNAITTEDMRKLNFRELEDISSVVPGLTLESDSVAPNASLRGVRFDAFASGNNPTVQFYINDAPAVSVDAVQAMFDLGQVEVLRGPQGTIRGRAAPSGAITLTTAKPDLEELGGYVDLTATNKGGRNARATVNVPILENKLGLRFAGLLEENEGRRIDSINNDESTEFETDGYRVSLRYEPLEALTIDLMHQQINPDRIENLQVESANRKDPSQPAPAQGPISPFDRLGVTDFPRDSEREIEYTNVNVKWDLDGLQLEYIGSLSEGMNKRVEPLDGGDFFGPGSDPRLQNLSQDLEGETESQTHELRLEASAGKFDFVVGGLYQDFESLNELTQDRAVFLPAFIGGGLATVAEVPIETDGTSTEKSIYGNVTWHLSDRTEVSGGLRYIDFENSQLVIVNGSPIADTDDDFSETIYLLSARHRFSDELMGYATLGSAWRPGTRVVGNFSERPSERERGFSSTDPEESTSLELGLKSELLDRRLRLNGAVFYQQFDDYVYRAGGNGVFFISEDANGNETVDQFNFVAGVPVDVFGVEVEAVYQATERWTVGGMYSWAQGQIDDGTIPCNDFFPTDGEPDKGGQQPTAQQIRDASGGEKIAACDVNFRANFAPLWTATLRSEYTFPLFGMDAFARGLLTTFGDSKNDPTNAIDEVDRYAILDVFAGVRDPEGKWEATLFVKNATETERVLTRNASPQSIAVTRLQGTVGPGGFTPTGSEGERNTSTYRQISVTKPREVGLSVRYNF